MKAAEEGAKSEADANGPAFCGDQRVWEPEGASNVAQPLD
jgi:hypothetical protein